MTPRWFKSSFTDPAGTCVEVAWSRSSLCAGGDCLEATRTSGDHAVVLVRDSKEGPAGYRLQAWTRAEWEELLDSIRRHDVHHPAIDWLTEYPSVVVFGLHRHEKLNFNGEEWDAFLAGVRAEPCEFGWDRLADYGSWARESDKLCSPASAGTGGAGRSVEPSAGALDRAATGTVPAAVPVAADSDSPAGRESSTAHPEADAFATAGQPGPEAATAGQGPVFADRSGVEAAGTGAQPPALVPVAQPGDVLAEVAEERARQDEKWGEQNHSDGTGQQHDDGKARMARNATEYAALQGRVTWRLILAEEVAEAFAESDPADLRAELIQIAAVATAWAEAIDRRAWTKAVAPLVPTDGAS